MRKAAKWGRPSGLSRAGLPLLLMLCITRLWLMPLRSSFSLDEMATVFVARFGSRHPSLAAAAPQAWKSVYYSLARGAEKLFGFSEVAYRLPSILAMALALWLISRLAIRFIHPQSGWLAVFACLSLRGLNYHAADARPYALGIAVAAASVLFLVRWFDSEGWGDALGFVVAAALLWRVHLLFWPLYVVFALYAAVRLARRETGVSWVRATAVFALLGLTLVPVFMGAVALYREAGAHVIAPPPSARQLAGSLKLTLIAVAGIGAWLLSRWKRVSGGATPRGPTRAALVLILGWWLCPPVCLFAFSWLTHNSVFVPRYLSSSLAGAALTATLAAALYIPAVQWRPAAAVLGAWALLFGGEWRNVWPLHHNSDWRAAAHTVNALSGGELPILCPSPFVEAKPPVWSPEYPLPGFLYAHLSVYPIRGHLYLLPFEDSPDLVEARFLPVSPQQAGGVPPLGNRFVIYGWEPQVHFWREWFARRPEFAGWHQRSLGTFADVDVVMFEEGARQ